MFFRLLISSKWIKQPYFHFQGTLTTSTCTQGLWASFPWRAAFWGLPSHVCCSISSSGWRGAIGIGTRATPPRGSSARNSCGRSGRPRWRPLSATIRTGSTSFSLASWKASTTIIGTYLAEIFLVLISGLGRQKGQLVFPSWTLWLPSGLYRQTKINEFYT